MEETKEKEVAPIQNLIYEVRGQKVMLDSDLAELYGVEVKRLNEAVKRNIERFPLDFMFQLTEEEWVNLRSQFATSSSSNGDGKLDLRSQFAISSSTNDEGEPDLRSQNVTSSLTHGGRRYMPYVFTEQGVAMLSGVVNSKCAIEVNINIMRAFVKLRRLLYSHIDTNEQIAELRKLLLLYIDKNDKRVNDIILALNNLIEKPKETRILGFHA